jgi:hypothetical protein
VEVAVEIHLNEPASMDYESSLEASDSDAKFLDDLGAVEDEEIVLKMTFV